MKQARTSFRVLGLTKPDMKFIFRSYLFMENFTLPVDTSNMLQQFFEKFEDLKFKALYEGKLDKQTTGDDEISLSNLRQALKLSKLLKDQEWAAFSASQIAKDRSEFKVVSTIDKFEVVSTQDNIGVWNVKQKDR